MDNRMTRGAAALTLLATVLTPVAVLAQENDLQGARAPGAESEMQRRGYSMTRTSGGAQFWWNDRTDTCVRVVVWQGRYQTVARASSSDCGKGGPSAGAVVGAAVAVGLIAALAGHKKQHDNNTSAAHDAEYSRGYNDGLYGAHYDQNDSEAYHDGYMAGESEASNRRASNRPYVRSAPQVSRDACTRSGDQYLNMPAGTTIPVSVTDIGRGQWSIAVAAGHYRARCTVDSRGNVSDMNPY